MTDSIYVANFEYASGDSAVIRGQLIYRAADHTTAFADAFRWFANRHTALPDFFAQLYALKVHRYSIAPVEDDGFCRTGAVPFSTQEWKCDWGVPPPVEMPASCLPRGFRTLPGSASP